MFDCFDKKYEGKVDVHFIGDMLRSLNLAVTNAECEKRGQMPKPGTKTISVEEFLAIYSEFFKMPDKVLFRKIVLFSNLQMKTKQLISKAFKNFLNLHRTISVYFNYENN